MTNKELAAQCLIEAAELLDESAGRNGSAFRMTATVGSNRLKNGETYEEGPWDDWYHGGREQRIKDLEKKARTGKDYRGGKPKLRGKDYLDERSIRQLGGKMSDIDVEAHNYNSKNPRLHKLINQNAELAEAKAKHKQALKDMPYRYEKLMRKSKNESVDIDALLEEAMDLLDY